MNITAEFINEVHDSLIPLFRDIPYGNSAWSTIYNDEDHGYFKLRLALCYGNTFKYDSFEEGDHDNRTVEEVIDEWKQAIAEATTTTTPEYEGDALVVNYAIGTIVCDTGTADEIEPTLIHQLIKLRDKLHNQ